MIGSAQQDGQVNVKNRKILSDTHETEVNDRKKRKKKKRITERKNNKNAETNAIINV